MVEQLLLGQRANPPQQRAGATTPDQRQMVLDEDLGDEPMIACGRGVLDRLDAEAAQPEPFRCAPVNLDDRARLPRGELEARELAEQRVHAEPAAVLEASDEQVRPLKL